MKMDSKLITILLLFYIVVYFAHGSGGTRNCVSTLSAIREMLDGHTRLPDTCVNCQGRPGKRGGVGPRGPIGPRGVNGEPGACECNHSAVEELARKVAELERFKATIVSDMSENPSVFPSACYAGVSSGKIPLSDITASSVHHSCHLYNVVLNSGSAWCAATNDGNQWVQVDLRTPKPITGVLTQGIKNCCSQWVTTYRVSFGNNTNSMNFYQEAGQTKVFTANTDKTTTVKNVFAKPITARYFRIHPSTFVGHMSMRVELLTC